MNFHDLPDDIISLIMFFRKIKTAAKKATSYIKAHWYGYRTRVLLGRFKMLKYLHLCTFKTPILRQVIF